MHRFLALSFSLHLCFIWGLSGRGASGARMMKEGDGFVRADQIDLKELDAQLERHLSRAWTMEKNAEKKPRQEWEIDPDKLIIKTVIARGTFGTVHRGIYDGQDVAGLSPCLSLSLSLSHSPTHSQTHTHTDAHTNRRFRVSKYHVTEGKVTVHAAKYGRQTWLNFSIGQI